jgi:hypothetical protein
VLNPYPHWVTHTKAVPVAGISGAEESVGFPDQGRRIRASVQPATFSRAFARAGVETSSGYIVMTKPADASGIHQGDRLAFGSLSLVVMAEPKVEQFWTGVDHAVIVAELPKP